MKSTKNVKLMVVDKEPGGRVKFCKTCGGSILYTRRSAPVWAQVEYCSAACRRMGVVHERMAASSSSQAIALSA